MSEYTTGEPAMVIGIYGDRSGIERVELATDVDHARRIVKRWLTQHYDGIVEVWRDTPCGAAEKLEEEGLR